MAFYTATFVLGNVNHPVDHNPGSIWDHSWVNSNGVLGAGNGTGTGVSSPACGAASARAVTGSFKNTQGNHLGSRFFNVFGSFCFLLILICAPAAYVLARFTFLGNKIIQTSFVSAMGIPITMIVLPLFSIVANLGILNSVFASKVTLIFLYIGINIPYTTIFLLTFFSNLSRTYEEAAAIDGCPPTKTFWKIMFPMAQSGIVTVTIFNFINIWNEYFLSLIFANNDTLRPVAVGLYGMLQSMQYTGNWAGMFAAVVIVFLPTFILYLFLSEKIIGGVTGGIKG